MNNIVQTLVCLLLCCFFCGKNTAQTPNASIATWKDNNKSAYTIVHDDYSNYVTGIYDYAYPNATQRGIKICFGAITSFCNETEWVKARTMITQGGHECVNHSHSHFCAVCSSNANTCVTNFGCDGFTTYSAPNFTNELQQSDSLIFANTGVKPRFFIHPYDNYTTEQMDYLKTLGYLGTRGGLQLTYNTPNYTDPYFMNYYVYGPFNQLTLAELNAALDETITARGHAVREFHGINDGSWGQVPLDTYISHLDYLKSKMDAKLMWSATISDVMTYKMQREVYETATNYNPLTGVLAVNFNQNLANLKGISPSLFTPSVMTTPITLNIDVIGISETLPLNAVQNNQPIFFIKKDNILSLNVYPHNGQVTLNFDLCGSDNIPPVFTNCPTNINILTTQSTAVASWIIPTASDNCTTLPTLTTTHASGTAFPLGETTVTYTATDAKNNVSTCSFLVKVIFANPCDTDSVKPVFTNCPNNIILTTSGNSTVVNWTPPTASDNCTTPPSVISTHNTGSVFPVGETTVTYTATDAKNNIETCSFKININLINACDADTVKPVFANCPANIVLSTSGTNAVANWSAPSVSDNCTTTPSVISSHNSGTAFPIGETTVIYTATDAKNNAETCIFKVNVNFINPCDTDTVKPIFNNCPANITLTTTGTTAVATWDLPTVTDNCTLTPSVTGTHLRGSAFPLGETTVSYTATDAKNNVGVCTFKINIVSTNNCANDIVRPVFSNCPNNINLTTTETSAIATWTLPTASDNCTTTPSVISTHNSGWAFPIGTTTVTYRADDANGNFSTCAFTVTVTLSQVNPCDNDVVKPVFTNCPANISLTTTGTTANATWTPPTATDNCTIPPSVSSTYNSGTAFPIGTTTVTYTATDAKNNTQTCTFTVIVTSVTTSPQDLALSIKIDRSRISRYRAIAFTISVKNTGNAAFTNVLVKFPLLSGVSSNGVATASHGIWQEFRNGVRMTEWSIPNLPANTTATLRVPTYIAYIPSGSVFTSTLINSTPVDIIATNNKASIAHIPFGLSLLSANTLEIDAAAEPQRIRIDWVSETDESLDYFAVQKIDTSFGDFKDLEIIDNVGKVDILQHHTVYDAQPTIGDNFYRLKQVFTSGRVVFSDVKKVVFGETPFFSIYPNPTDSELNINLKHYKGKNVEVHLYNTIGQEVFTKMLENVGDTPYIFNISKLNEGQYLIRVVSKGKNDAVKMVSKL
jgi:peptidoglycan/xylan/chitin deacetylase (PgdA/CDA1 family)